MLVKIAAWYDILLGILVFTVSKPIFDFFEINRNPEDPFLFASGLFVLAFGYLLQSIPITDLNFPKIAYSSAFVRIGFFISIVFLFIRTDQFILGYFLLSCCDLITGLMLLIAINTSDNS